MAIEFRKMAAAQKGVLGAREKIGSVVDATKIPDKASSPSTRKPAGTQAPPAIHEFVNETNVALAMNMPDFKYTLLPGEGITFKEVKMTPEQENEVKEQREKRRDYKREKSKKLMRELHQARKLGIDVKEYRKQKKANEND